MCLLLGIFSTCILGTTLAVSNVCDNLSFTNDVGTVITYQNLDKLETMGFSFDENNQFSWEKYQKFENIDIISSKRKDYVSYDSSESLNNENDGVSTTAILNNGPYLENGHGGSSSTGGNISSYSDIDWNKNMVTIITKYKENGVNMFFVKQKVTWVNSPEKRYSDILTISYLDNVILQSTSLGKPDIEMRFSYKQTDSQTYKYIFSPAVNSSDVTYYDNVYNGENTEMYNHKLGSYISFKFNLPKDDIRSFSSNTYYFIESTNYTDFQISMEATFKCNDNSIISTAIESQYVHQVQAGSFDWGSVSFSATPPYISYQTTFYKNDPAYDEGLYNYMNVEF